MQNNGRRTLSRPPRLHSDNRKPEGLLLDRQEETSTTIHKELFSMLQGRRQEDKTKTLTLRHDETKPDREHGHDVHLQKYGAKAVASSHERPFLGIRSAQMRGNTICSSGATGNNGLDRHVWKNEHAPKRQGK